MSTISGYQVRDIKTSGIELLGLAYLTAIIEVQGCTFTGCVQLDSTAPDPFADARAKAIEQALADSKRSDFKLYGRASGGGGWSGSRGGQGASRPQDPNAKASDKQLGRMYGIAKDLGIDRASVTRTIKGKGWDPEQLTVGQVDEVISLVQAAAEKKPKREGQPA